MRWGLLIILGSAIAVASVINDRAGLVLALCFWAAVTLDVIVGRVQIRRWSKRESAIDVAETQDKSQDQLPIPRSVKVRAEDVKRRLGNVDN